MPMFCQDVCALRKESQSRASSAVHWLWPHDSKLILPGLTKAEAEMEAVSLWTHKNETSIQPSSYLRMDKMESYMYIYIHIVSYMEGPQANIFLTSDGEFNEAINHGRRNDIG